MKVFHYMLHHQDQQIFPNLLHFIISGGQRINVCHQVETDTIFVLVLKQSGAAGGKECIFKLSDYQVRGDNWDWGGINWAEIICSDLVKLEATSSQIPTESPDSRQWDIPR